MNSAKYNVEEKTRTLDELRDEEQNDDTSKPHFESAMQNPQQPDSKDTSTSNRLSLKIKPLETEGNFPQRPLMKENIIPRMASSSLIVGGTGSGKTVLLVNLLIRPEFYKDYFDRMYLFSPTGGTDPTFKLLIKSKQLKKQDVITTDFESRLSDIVNEQQAHVESLGNEFKAKKICVIFEDLSSLKRLQRSEAFEQCFVQNRHLAMMVFAVVHKLSALTRVARLQAANIFFFPSPNSEVEILIDENAPPNLTKDQFREVIRLATAGSHNFLHINNRVPYAERYRRNLDTIIELPGYKKSSKRMKDDEVSEQPRKKAKTEKEQELDEDAETQTEKLSPQT